MTKAFVVEYKDGDVIKYVGKRGHLGRVPVFFRTAAALKYHTQRRTYYGSKDYVSLFTPTQQAQLTIIMIDFLELGMQKSVATRLTYADFMSRDSSTKVVLNNRDAVYKIRLSTVGGSSFVGLGKFGEVFRNAGLVRSYLSRNLSVLDRSGRWPQWDNAEVVEIELERDGYTPKKVTSTPVLEFYLKSPTSRKTWEQFKRGSKSLEVFNRNPHITSDRSEFK